MTALSVKQYDDLETYSAEIEPHLLIQECKNTFFLLTLQRAIKEQKEGNTGIHYCNAVWNNKGELVFALFRFYDSILYGSYLLNDQYAAVEESIKVFVAQEKHTKLSWAHAFQPALGCISKCLTEHTDINLKLIDEVSCYDTREVQWSSKALSLKHNPLVQLRVADASFDFIEDWANRFLDDSAETDNMIRVPVSALGVDDQIKDGAVYVLFYDNEPVCMVWKRRPTKNGIAISLVFTPKDKRGHGYANCSVSLLTELLLKEFQYVTLFVDSRKNLKDNLYTRAGYKLIGEGGRLLVTDVGYKNMKF